MENSLIIVFNLVELSIIIVNYQSQDYLKKCLQSIEFWLRKNNQANLDLLEIIISNNDPSPLPLETTEITGFPVQILNNQKNLGFAKANNRAAKEATGELLLFLNPDTSLVDDSLFLMLEEMKKGPDIKIMGPVLIQASRSAPQPWTCGKKTSLFGILFRNTILKPWNSQKIQLVDWVSGAALLIQREIFQKLNGFDENFFAYFEDQDLCLRAKELDSKNKVIFFPKTRVLHHDGKSWLDSKSQKAHFYQSQNRFFQKHHGVLSRFLLKLIRKLSGKA